MNTRNLIIIALLLVLCCPSPSRAATTDVSIHGLLASLKNLLWGAHNSQQKETGVPIQNGIEKLPFNSIVVSEAKKQKLDPCLLHAIIRHESNYHAQAVSSKGAKGLMQLMPATARELGVSNHFDPRENIAAGARYYKMMFNQFGDHRLALIAYNSGPGTVSKGVRYKESEQYANRVIRTWNHLYQITYATIH